MNKSVKRLGSVFVYGLTHPFDGDLSGVSVDDLNFAEAYLSGATAGFGQVITQGIIGLGLTMMILAGIGFVDSKLNKTPIKVKMVIDQESKK